MKYAITMCLGAAALSLGGCGATEENRQDQADANAQADAEESANAVESAAEEAAPVAEPATGGPAPKAAEAPAAAPSAAAQEAGKVAMAGPPDSYLVCGSCHSVEPGKQGIGPSMAGIYGSKAASVAGFSYSDALKSSDIVWTDANLDKWLQSPMKMVPGTRMAFSGVSDAGKRKELIAYLKSLK